MKLRLLLCCALAAAVSGPLPLPRRRDHRSNLTSRSDRARTWLERRVLSQGRRVHPNLLADEFVATYDDGSQGDKAKELALAMQFNQQVESAVQEDFAVRTAIPLWSGSPVIGVRQGQRSELLLRYTTSG